MPLAVIGRGDGPLPPPRLATSQRKPVEANWRKLKFSLSPITGRGQG